MSIGDIQDMRPTGDPFGASFGSNVASLLQGAASGSAPSGITPSLPSPGGGGGGFNLGNLGKISKAVMPAILSAIAMKQGGPAAAAGLLRGLADQREAQRRRAEAREAAELESIQDEHERAQRQQQSAMQNYRAAVADAEAARRRADPSWDDAEIAQYVTDLDAVLVKIYGVPPGVGKTHLAGLARQISTEQQQAAKALIANIRKEKGDEYLSEAVTRNMSIDFMGKPRPMTQVLKLAEFAMEPVAVPLGIRGGVTPALQHPKLPTPNPADEIKGASRRDNMIRGRLQALRRKWTPDERLQIEADVDQELLDEQLKLREASRGRTSGRAPAATNPRGAASIPQGVEAYILSMRDRGYTQQEALDEALKDEVRAKLFKDHPSLTAQRLRTAITQLIPTGGVASGKSTATAPTASAPRTTAPGKRVQRTMTLEELRALAEAFNITEAEARRIYEARGVVIR